MCYDLYIRLNVKKRNVLGVISEALHATDQRGVLRLYPSPSMLRYLFVLGDLRVSHYHQTCIQELACGIGIRVLISWSPHKLGFSSKMRKGNFRIGTLTIEEVQI